MLTSQTFLFFWPYLTFDIKCDFNFEVVIYGRVTAETQNFAQMGRQTLFQMSKITLPAHSRKKGLPYLFVYG